VRVVSLTCSNTEIVCALGRAADLVGVDDYSDYPPEVVAGLARLGPDLGIDVARVAALEPDLVLASLTVPGHEQVVEALERAGLRYVAPAPESLADVLRDVRDIAALLGVPEAAGPVVAELEAAIAPCFLSPSTFRPSIAVEWWPKPVILPGRRSWVHDLLLAAGAGHPLEDEAVKSRPLEDKELAAKAPDAIVLAWCGVELDKYRPDVLYRNPAFTDIPAIRHGRVYCVAEAFLGRPGPRLVEGYRALRAIVDELSTASAR
jgi:iron complex transport system substrate-binding protein